MTTPEAPKFGVKFPSRKERTVKRVTKCETREIQKRIFFLFFSYSQHFIYIIQGLQPPKPATVRPPPKPKAPKKPKQPPATLCKPPKPPRILTSHYRQKQVPLVSRTVPTSSTSRTLQTSDIEKLARLSCSREFSLFHQYIKSELSKCYENPRSGLLRFDEDVRAFRDTLACKWDFTHSVDGVRDVPAFCMRHRVDYGCTLAAPSAF